MLRSTIAIALLAASTTTVSAQAFPGRDYVIHNFKFESGETLPELRMHYVTLGQPRKDAAGIVRNAVIINHGTTGSGVTFVGHTWADQSYGPGQILDTTKFYIVIPDGIGHGKIRCGASAWVDGKTILEGRFSTFAVAVSGYCFCANRVILTRSTSSRPAEM